MMTIRELQTQLLNDYGIRSEWIACGGGNWCLTVQIGDSSEYGEWLEIGSLDYIHNVGMDTPVNTFSATLVDNGNTDMYSDGIEVHDMARTIARDMLERTGILHP